MTQTFTVPPQAQSLFDLNRQAFETAQQLNLAAMIGMEKLFNLNAQAFKAIWEEQISRASALLETRDARTLQEALNSGFTPANEKLASYTQHLLNISHETAADMQKILEKQFGEQGRQISAAVETMTRSVPNGMENVLPIFESAVDSANNVVDQYNKASRQVAEMAEAQLNEAAATMRSAATRRKSA